MSANEDPDPIDITVGQNIRTIRRSQGVSQSALAEALGVTFQQVQKYEKASNRVSASALFKTAKRLSVPLERLYEGAPADG